MGFQLEGVGLAHPGGAQVLHDICLHVRQGEQVALIGPSGAGKTTLLNLLATALAPGSGSATVLGQPLGRAAPTRALRARIGMVHQAPPLPPRQRVVTAVLAGRLGRWPAWKALASLLYPLDMAGARDALARVQLQDKLFARCDQLSGGQLQRVGVARVLYQEPALLLADEPVSALDPTLAQASVALLVQQAQRSGATLVASLHAVDLALAAFPRVVGLRGGRIAFDLPAGQVSPAQLQALYAQAATAPQAAAPAAAAPASPSMGYGACG
jgi:phosphonate transport system ATP-binding protein